MNNVNDVFSWLQSTGIVAFLIAVLPATYKLFKPLMAKKIATEKNTHVKQALEVGQSLADAIVPEMAIMVALSKSDRRTEAIRFVDTKLAERGLDLDLDTIAALVEKAYQAHKVSGADNHAPNVTPAPTTSTIGSLGKTEGVEDDD